MFCVRASREGTKVKVTLSWEAEGDGGRLDKSEGLLAKFIQEHRRTGRQTKMEVFLCKYCKTRI